MVIKISSFADFTNRRAQAARASFRNPGDLDLDQDSDYFGASNGPNVKTAKLLKNNNWTLAILLVVMTLVVYDEAVVPP